MSHFYLILSLAFLAVGCSSSHKKAQEDVGFERRVMKPDYNKVSRFEKAFNTKAAGNRGWAGLSGRKTVKGSDVAGLKNFKSTDFQTGSFKSGKHSAPFANKQSRFGSAKNRMGDAEVSTKASRLGSESARQGKQMFSGADDTVHAHRYMPGEKSLHADKRPMVIADPSAPQERVAYTQEEIQKLLGR